MKLEDMVLKLRDYKHGSGYMGRDICSLDPEEADEIADALARLTEFYRAYEGQQIRMWKGTRSTHKEIMIHIHSLYRALGDL